MRTINWLIFFMAFFSPFAVFSAQDSAVPDERILLEECGVFSQAGMRECLLKKVKESQKALLQAEQDINTVLSRWDEDNKYINEAKTKLVSSNKTFTAYRETQCEFSASLSGGGNGRSIARPACVADLNNRRAAQLHDWMLDLPQK